MTSSRRPRCRSCARSSPPRSRPAAASSHPAALVFNALRLTPFDVGPGRDPGPGSLPRPRARRWGSASRFRQAFRRRRRSATSSSSSAPTSACRSRATGDLTPWAERGVLLLNSVLTVAPGSPASHAGQGLGAVHRPGHRGALGPPRGNRLPPLGPLRAAEGRRSSTPRRHHVLTAAHPSPYSAANGFFGCRHFSRANGFLEARRPAARRLAAASTLSLHPGQGAPSNSAPRDRRRRAGRGPPRRRCRGSGGRETECPSEAASATRPGVERAPRRCARRPARDAPTSEGALRQSSAPCSTSGRTHQGSAATARQRSGCASTGTSPAAATAAAASATSSIASSISSHEPGNSTSTASVPSSTSSAGADRRAPRSGTPPSRGAGRAPSRRPRHASARASAANSRRATRCGEMCPRDACAWGVANRIAVPASSASRQARAPPRSCARRRRRKGRHGSARRRSRS